jgi:hypothetical protein
VWREANRGSSMKPSYAATKNLIDRTRNVWQPRTGRQLTGEDARQIAENVTGFFSILAEWSSTEISTPASDGVEQDTCEREDARYED